MKVCLSDARKILILAITCLLTSPVIAQPDSDAQSVVEISGGIDALIDPHIDAGLLSGEILIARGDRVLFHRSFGYASWELRVENTAEARYGIASVSKTLTETLVTVLAEAETLDLDAPVARYIPDFPNGPEGGEATIKHLVMHRAGVPHRVTTPVEETQVLLASDIVSRIRDTGLMFEPGTRRTYSSAGYTSLARAIELVEQKPFAQVLNEHILVPAGMASTVSETGQTLIERRALSHRLGADDQKIAVKSTPYKDLRFLTGAGSVYSTGTDLVRFVSAIKNGVFGDQIQERYFGENPEIWQSFTGRTNGYETSIDVNANGELVFVFLSNLQSASNWQVRERIKTLLQGDDATPIPLPPSVSDRFEDQESILGSFGAAEIRLIGNNLFRGDNEIYPIDGNRYYIPASGTTMHFRRNEAGQVDALVSVSGGGRESLLLKSAIR